MPLTHGDSWQESTTSTASSASEHSSDPEDVGPSSRVCFSGRMTVRGDAGRLTASQAIAMPEVEAVGLSAASFSVHDRAIDLRSFHKDPF